MNQVAETVRTSEDTGVAAPVHRQQIYDTIHHEDTPQVVKRYLKTQLYGEAEGPRRSRFLPCMAATKKGHPVRRSPKPQRPAHISGRQWVKLRKQARKVVRHERAAALSAR